MLICGLNQQYSQAAKYTTLQQPTVEASYLYKLMWAAYHILGYVGDYLALVNLFL